MPIFGQKHYRVGHNSRWYCIILEIPKTINDSTKYHWGWINCKECFYLKQLLKEIGYEVAITVYCDSTSAIAMIRNPVQRQKCKSFFVVYHAVRAYHQLGITRYERLSGALQPADMFTKSLPYATLERHMKTLHFGGKYHFFLHAAAALPSPDRHLSLGFFNLCSAKSFPEPLFTFQHTLRGKRAQRGNSHKFVKYSSFTFCCSKLVYRLHILRWCHTQIFNSNWWAFKGILAPHISAQNLLQFFFSDFSCNNFFFWS